VGKRIELGNVQRAYVSALEQIKENAWGNNLPWWPFRPKQCAYENVGVQDGAQHGLFAPSLSELRPACPMLRLVCKGVGFILGQGPVLLALQKIEELLTCEALHLFEPLHRHHGSHGLALTLDDELVVAERDTIKDVTESLPYLQGENLLRHALSQLLQLS